MLTFVLLAAQIHTRSSRAGLPHETFGDGLHMEVFPAPIQGWNPG